MFKLWLNRSNALSVVYTIYRRFVFSNVKGTFCVNDMCAFLGNVRLGRRNPWSLSSGNLSRYFGKSVTLLQIPFEESGLKIVLFLTM